MAYYRLGGTAEERYPLGTMTVINNQDGTRSQSNAVYLCTLEVNDVITQLSWIDSKLSDIELSDILQSVSNKVCNILKTICNQLHLLNSDLSKMLTQTVEEYHKVQREMELQEVYIWDNKAKLEQLEQQKRFLEDVTVTVGKQLTQAEKAVKDQQSKKLGIVDKFGIAFGSVFGCGIIGGAIGVLAVASGLAPVLAGVAVTEVIAGNIGGYLGLVYGGVKGRQSINHYKQNHKDNLKRLTLIKDNEEAKLIDVVTQMSNINGTIDMNSQQKSLHDIERKKLLDTQNCLSQQYNCVGDLCSIVRHYVSKMDPTYVKAKTVSGYLQAFTDVSPILDTLESMHVNDMNIYGNAGLHILLERTKIMLGHLSGTTTKLKANQGRALTPSNNQAIGAYNNGYPGDVVTSSNNQAIGGYSNRYPGGVVTPSNNPAISGYNNGYPGGVVTPSNNPAIGGYNNGYPGGVVTPSTNPAISGYNNGYPGGVVTSVNNPAIGGYNNGYPCGVVAPSNSPSIGGYNNGYPGGVVTSSNNPAISGYSNGYPGGVVTPSNNPAIGGYNNGYPCGVVTPVNNPAIGGYNNGYPGGVVTPSNNPAIGGYNFSPSSGYQKTLDKIGKSYSFSDSSPSTEYKNKSDKIGKSTTLDDYSNSSEKQKRSDKFGKSSSFSDYSPSNKNKKKSDKIGKSTTLEDYSPSSEKQKRSDRISKSSSFSDSSPSSGYQRTLDKIGKSSSLSDYNLSSEYQKTSDKVDKSTTLDDYSNSSGYERRSDKIGKRSSSSAYSHRSGFQRTLDEISESSSLSDFSPSSGYQKTLDKIGKSYSFSDSSPSTGYKNKSDKIGKNTTLDDYSPSSEKQKRSDRISKKSSLSEYSPYNGYQKTLDKIGKSSSLSDYNPSSEYQRTSDKIGKSTTLEDYSPSSEKQKRSDIIGKSSSLSEYNPSSEYQRRSDKIGKRYSFSDSSPSSEYQSTSDKADKSTTSDEYNPSSEKQKRSDRFGKRSSLSEYSSNNGYQRTLDKIGKSSSLSDYNPSSEYQRKSDKIGKSTTLDDYSNSSGYERRSDKIGKRSSLSAYSHRSGFQRTLDEISESSSLSDFSPSSGYQRTLDKIGKSYSFSDSSLSTGYKNKCDKICKSTTLDDYSPSSGYQRKADKIGKSTSLSDSSLSSGKQKRSDKIGKSSLLSDSIPSSGFQRTSDKINKSSCLTDSSPSSRFKKKSDKIDTRKTFDDYSPGSGYQRSSDKIGKSTTLDDYDPSSGYQRKADKIGKSTSLSDSSINSGFHRTSDKIGKTTSLSDSSPSSGFHRTSDKIGKSSFLTDSSPSSRFKKNIDKIDARKTFDDYSPGSEYQRSSDKIGKSTTLDDYSDSSEYERRSDKIGKRSSLSENSLNGFQRTRGKIGKSSSLSDSNPSNGLQGTLDIVGKSTAMNNDNGAFHSTAVRVCNNPELSDCYSKIEKGDLKEMMMSIPKTMAMVRSMLLLATKKDVSVEEFNFRRLGNCTSLNSALVKIAGELWGVLNTMHVNAIEISLLAKLLPKETQQTMQAIINHEPNSRLNAKLMSISNNSLRQVKKIKEVDVKLEGLMAILAELSDILPALKGEANESQTGITIALEVAEHSKRMAKTELKNIKSELVELKEWLDLCECNYNRIQNSLPGKEMLCLMIVSENVLYYTDAITAVYRTITTLSFMRLNLKAKICRSMNTRINKDKRKGYQFAKQILKSVQCLNYYLDGDEIHQKRICTSETALSVEEEMNQSIFQTDDKDLRQLCNNCIQLCSNLTEAQRSIAAMSCEEKKHLASEIRNIKSQADDICSKIAKEIGEHHIPEDIVTLYECTKLIHASLCTLRKMVVDNDVSATMESDQMLIYCFINNAQDCRKRCEQCGFQEFRDEYLDIDFKVREFYSYILLTMQNQIVNHDVRATILDYFSVTQEKVNHFQSKLESLCYAVDHIDTKEDFKSDEVPQQCLGMQSLSDLAEYWGDTLLLARNETYLKGRELLKANQYVQSKKSFIERKTSHLKEMEQTCALLSEYIDIAAQFKVHWTQITQPFRILNHVISETQSMTLTQLHQRMTVSMQDVTNELTNYIIYQEIENINEICWLVSFLADNYEKVLGVVMPRAGTMHKELELNRATDYRSMASRQCLIDKECEEDVKIVEYIIESTRAKFEASQLIAPPEKAIGTGNLNPDWF